MWSQAEQIWDANGQRLFMWAAGEASLILPVTMFIPMNKTHVFAEKILLIKMINHTTGQVFAKGTLDVGDCITPVRLSRNFECQLYGPDHAVTLEVDIKLMGGLGGKRVQ